VPADFFICQYFRPPDRYFIQKNWIKRIKRPYILPLSAPVNLPNHTIDPRKKSDIKIRPEGRTFKRLLLSLSGKTIAAIYRAIVPGLERNLAGFPAGCADCIVHLTLGPAAIFPRSSAGRTSFGFISESLFFKKVLFACSECEFLTAVDAYERFVLMSQI
jgi:hypothetical protein